MLNEEKSVFGGRIINLFVITVIFIVFAGSVSTQERIKFKKGEISATVEGGIARGETYSYLAGASKNQFMTVTIMSVEDNAVFQILDKSTGEYLPGTEVSSDTRRWEGILPSTGDYKIVVGSTRGGAEYTMMVVIE